MSAPPAARKRRRGLVALLVGVLVLGCVVAPLFYLRSQQFNDLVRQEVIASLEKATGGRVELQSFHWNLSRLDLEAANLIVHGLEPSGEAPLAQVAKVRVRAHVISLLHRQVDLSYLELDQPQIYIRVDRDGKTNIPEPKQKVGSDLVQLLFDLAISRAEVRDGLLRINNRQLPLDFSADDVVTAASFNRSDRRYDGTLSLGKIAAKYQDYREIPLAAQAEFSMWQNRAHITRLRLQSQGSYAEINGNIINFSDPETSFEYAATVDLPQAAAIARLRGLGKGTATLAGNASHGAGGYSATGKLSARGVDYVAEGSQFRNVNLSADFQAGNAGFKLSNLVGRVLGGEISGTLEASHAPPASGQAQLKLTALSLAEVARAFSSRQMPLDKMKLMGSVNGGVKLVWKGAPSRGLAEFALDVNAPPQPAPGALPLAGTVHGSYEVSSGLLELRPLQLSTPGTQISASGRIGYRSAALNLTLQTTNLGEVDAVLNAVGQPAMPLELAGSASFTGTVNGNLRDPEVAGHLQASQFTYLYTPSQPSGIEPPHPSPIHVDSFNGDVSYSQTEIALHRAVVNTGGMTLNFDGDAALEHGDLTDDSVFQLTVAMQNGDVSSLQKMLGTDYPLTGQVNVTMQAAGTKANPHGRGSFALTKATIYGRPVDSLASDVLLQNDLLHLANAKLKAPGGSIAASGSYDLGTRQIVADLESDDIQLAHVPEFQLQRLRTTGTAQLKLHASGTPQSPVVDAHLKIARLVLNQEHVGDLTLDAATHEQKMVITGRSKFEHANLMLDGAVDMNGNLPGVLDVQFSNLDIDPFLTEQIKGRLTAHSGVAGRVHLAGPFRLPRQLSGGVTIDSFHAELENVPVQSDGPIEIALSDGALDIKRLAFTSADTELRVEGNLELVGAQQVRLAALGSVNMALLQTLNPELTSSGKANVDVRVRGGLRQPLITGRVQLANVSVSDIDLPAALADLNGSLVFNQSRVEIESLTGHVGGGEVEFAGYISYANGVAFNLTSEGRDIRFRYSGISITANQDLKVQGTFKNATVSGDITITRFAQIPSADLAAAFANASAPVPNAMSPLNNLHLDVHVRSAPELTVQTSLAKLSGDADLRVKGTALNPVLLGRVNIAQGDLKINGQKYFLERGDITFANPVRLDPLLDVEAKTRVRDFDITIGLHGTLERLSTTYRSDPPLSSEDIISLLTLGRTQQEYGLAPTASGAGLGEATGNAVIGAAINQLVANRVSRLFGVSAIRINPAAGGGPDNNPNARLTVEQQVSSNVTITYITNLSRSAQQVLELEYNVARDYTINATRDENGVVSFDLLIRKRRK